MWTAACTSCEYRGEEGATYVAAEREADQHELETGHRVAVARTEATV